MTAPTRCGCPWPVCPRCLGTGLLVSAGKARCPSCGQTWTAADVTPCPGMPATELRDAAGNTVRICFSHALHPSAALLTPITRRK